MAPMTLDPYATLGIPRGASRDVAARAHRRLAKRFHPDLNPGPAAAAQMGRINEAWRILSDPARRTQYDAGRTAPAWPGPGYHSDWGPAARPSSSYGPRPRAAGWEPWPESRTAGRAGFPGAVRRQQAEPSAGDRPVVFVTLWVILALLFFIGTWLGSISP